ncbi:LytR/AlgR family response regulator transcription factor [Sediminitomix flava]|uniref:LytTR family two component transcriptional regulator n=1 Tax=Sediminitomix flava TaxID=379075 RepID=A0A315ZDZ2_SEDFL|nr:LytTR family DNA-binding domain-containing protein [Sediminitomix flava]PWJ43836.1 LytTR family two component transcriptional regulator [Sediminitomix flava]
MKYCIIEDEKHSRLMLEALIKKVRPTWVCTNFFDRVSTAVEWYKENPQPDLFFVDVQLKDGVSFSIFEQVKSEAPIIFTTAYDEFAIRAFEVKSVDYLLKPIDENKLVLAISKFEEYHSETERKQTDFDELLALVKSGKQEYRKRFMVSNVDSYFKIDVGDIAFFKSENGLTKAILFNGEEHHLDLTLEKLEYQLDPIQFFRANRHLILHIDAVVKFENYFGGKLSVFTKPSQKEDAIISRLKASAFKKWFDQ